MKTKKFAPVGVPTESAPVVLALKKRRMFTWDLMEPLVKIMVLVLGSVIILIALDKQVLFSFKFREMLRMKSPFFLYLFIFNSLAFLFMLIFRTVLWFKYQPAPSETVSHWPGVTVVVPAFNEGETVYQTICSVAESDYPRNMLKIISIDDGSVDDTFEHMQRAARLYPDMVKLIRFDKNKGKRQAVYTAFQKTASPFFVTVDSDTGLESQALKELLTPMILDPKISAVTGRIKIWNGDANLFTKMLKANFAMAFDFTRAVQSTFSSVFCTSGAFSAYRGDTLKKFIHQWLDQRFMNRPCTYGEDRSLTNHILRTGAGTLYQRTAVAYTMVPEKAVKVLKMLTRWARSNIRESIIFSRIMFNSNRKGNYTLPFIEFTSTVIILFMHIAMFYFFLLSGFVDADFILRAAAYTMLFGFFYTLYYIRIEGVKDFPYLLAYSIFSSLVMVWIFTVAAITVNKRGWSTR